jgi:hypothetical protein
MKTFALAALPLLSLALIPACASSTTDELAGETPDDEALDGKADGAVDGVYTYFEVTADLRKCASPVCGGFFLDRLNRSTTTCHDGSSQTACYTPVLDMSQSGLPDSALDKLVGKANQGAASAGVHAIVRGRFAKTNTTTPRPEMGRFIVTEVWLSQTDAVSDGVFAKIKDAGIRCIAAPCSSTIEKGLNTSRSAMIAEVDFAQSAVDEHLLETIGLQMYEPSGVIIAGDRFTVHENGHTAKGRTATAVYLRVVDAPAAACFVGGCSSQVCSDQEGVITTCEYLPEYACYQTATCERQADNSCGWTTTPELDACLASH